MSRLINNTLRKLCAAGIQWENMMLWPGNGFTNSMTATLTWWNLQKYKAATLSLENSLDEFRDFKLYLLWEVWCPHLFLWLNFDNKGCKPWDPALPFNFSIVRSLAAFLCLVPLSVMFLAPVLWPQTYVSMRRCPSRLINLGAMCHRHRFTSRETQNVQTNPFKYWTSAFIIPFFCDLWLPLSLSSCDTSAVNMSCGGKKGEKVHIKTFPGEQILPLPPHLTAALNLTLNDKVTLRRTSAEAGTIFMRNVRQRVWLPRVINQGAVHACRDLPELSVPTVSMKC